MAICKISRNGWKILKKTHFFHAFPMFVRKLDRKSKKRLCNFVRIHLRNKMTPKKNMCLKNCLSSIQNGEQKWSFQESQKTKAIHIVYAIFNDFNIHFEGVAVALVLWNFISWFPFNNRVPWDINKNNWIFDRFHWNPPLNLYCIVFTIFKFEFFLNIYAGNIDTHQHINAKLI